jgi:hypothetical protein
MADNVTMVSKMEALVAEEATLKDERSRLKRQLTLEGF